MYFQIFRQIYAQTGETDFPGAVSSTERELLANKG